MTGNLRKDGSPSPFREFGKKADLFRKVRGKQGSSSSGRANDSKSLGRGFESLLPCQLSRHDQVAAKGPRVRKSEMENTNSKILTSSFALASALVGFTVHLLIKILAGAFGVVARLTDGDVVRHGLPVAVGLVMFAALQFNPKIHTWGEEVVAEVRKVVFPGGKDVSAMTVVVVVFVLIASLIIATFDIVSAQVMSLLVK